MTASVRFSFWIVTRALLFAGMAIAADGDVEQLGTRSLPPTDDAHVRLVLTKKEYYLGENILLHYCLENNGKAPFSIEMGGDYRGASRSLRFTVQAIDAQGKRVADPDPSGYSEGGVSIQPEIKPGETYFESLPLARYCRFDAPGVYTIRVKHDLGWATSDKKRAPVAEIKITLLQPDENQARAMLLGMEHLPDDPNSTWGQMREPYADFSVLRQPVYLPILVEMAEKADKNSERALVGIASIPTPEATQALLQLMQHKKSELALSAAETLNARLPDPEAEKKAPPRGAFVDPWLLQRREMAKTSWKPEFAERVRAQAKTLLSADARRQIDGAFMLECVGTSDDFPVVLRALDGALDESRRTPRPTKDAPPPPGSCGELMRAGEILLRRGAKFPTDPQSPAEIALFLNEMARHKEFRPVGWEARCAKWLAGDVPYLRELCLTSMPAIPAACASKLPELLADADLGVRIAACRAAGLSKRFELREPILKIIATAKEDALINAANNAAYQLGIFADCVERWIHRLDERGMEMKSLTTLIGLVVGNSGFSAGDPITPPVAAAIKAAWKDFFAANRKEIESAHRAEPGGKELKAEMFPPKFKLFGKNNEPWP